MAISSYSVLGKKTAYDAQYNPDLLFPISRKEQRKELGISTELPFFGEDIWNHYEVSWINEKGKPVVALAEIIYACDTPKLIESKSMKLYFNSFNNTKISNIKALQEMITNDISIRIEGEVIVNIMPILDCASQQIVPLIGICLDDLDIECQDYTVNSELLSVEKEIVCETVYSHLLKSNCLVTDQPDWGSVQIIYKGHKINHANLLRYIVSFRNHNEFGEHCVERIFMDILKYCKPEELTVYGRYTRRGGLDINPYRSTHKHLKMENLRLIRQ